MSSPVTIQAFDVIGGLLCSFVNKSWHVHDQTAPLTHDWRQAILRFEQVEMLIQTFHNPATGQPYRELQRQQIGEMPSVCDMDAAPFAVLDFVVVKPKEHFKSPKQ
jgi:hypothetical protein